MTSAPAPVVPHRSATREGASPARAAIASATWAIFSVLVGLMPWLTQGAQLPLQNIWAEATLPDDMPVALLPFSQYHVTDIAAMLVVGGLVAGLGSAVLARRGLFSRTSTTVTLAAAQTVCIAQTAAVTGGGLEDSRRATVYLTGLVVAALVSMVVAVLVYRALTQVGVPARTLGFSVAAIAFSMWASQLLYAAWGVGGTPPAALTSFAYWLPSLVVGLGVARCGVAGVRRATASAGSLALLWVLPAAATALQYALGGRVYLQNPSELWPAGSEVFRMALGWDGLGPQRVLVALAVALVGWAARRTLLRRAGH